ncbi:MAG: GNAT family N-acetyltransferase [Deltaproteobacteria bacterium]|nr:GNAT family N-acetyltransferase [Deltaproteobacteria bacterium]MBW2393003.1 GNAT family N-acetyltransferase [Deltaproteobacteria bacterium]
MIEIRSVAAERIRPLRQQVLRPNQPAEELIYPGDDAPGSFHLAAYRGDRLVGTITLSLEEREEGGSARGSYRLRGMAIALDAQGNGIGARLLAEAIEKMSAADGEQVWCNARLSAAGFYDRHGFHRIGSEFDLPGIGPHVVMEREF